MTIVAVSGAGGFIGQALCAELILRGNSVQRVSRTLLASNELATSLRGVNSFVHLAARAHVLKEQASDAAGEFYRSNVGLTQAAAAAAARAGVRRFVFVSSAGVLGASSPAGGFQEDSPPRPHDAYTLSKLQAEQWLQAERPQCLELAIVRPPLVFGPGARGNLMRLMRLALRGWPLPIGALTEPRSVVGIRNLVDLLCLLATTSQPVQALPMLVADRELTSVSQMYATAAQHAGRHPWLAPVPAVLIKSVLGAAGRTADIPRLMAPFVLVPRVAQNLFAWNPPFQLDMEIRRTVLAELQRSRCTSIQ